MKHPTIPNVVTLEVLLHYVYSPEAYTPWSPAVVDAVRFLLKHELLFKPFDEPPDTRSYEASAKGKFFVDHLLTIPIPVVVEAFKIPTDE